MFPSPDIAPDEPGIFQHPQVLGDRGKRRLEGRGERGDGRFPPGEPCEHGPTGRVGEGVKDAGQLGRRTVNHMVKY